MRTFYCHPVDVLRKFDPTKDETFLSDELLYGSDDLEKIIARIEEVESDFDTMTSNPQRTVRYGTPGYPASYEVADADFTRHQSGVKVWLKHPEVLPLDSAKDDVLEIRTGRNTWTDMTDSEGTRWEMNHEKGWIRIYSRLISMMPRYADKYMRITYRYNGLGGSEDRPGQTRLTSNVAEGDTTLDVESPERLPPRGILFIGGDEYVHLSSRDMDAGQIEVARGVRGTTSKSHDSDTIVHYCNPQLRGIVAGQAAAELVMNDDITDDLATPDDDISRNDRLTNWQEKFEKAKAKYSKVTSI